MTIDAFAIADDGLIGRVISDKFCIKSCVGTGASGSVYQADQLVLGRTVAVKILRPDLTADPRFAARFHDEALAASRLNHPNTISIIDYGQTDDGLLYLVMEFLRGATLSNLMRSEDLSSERTIDIVAQILLGLEEAHEAGVVHADLKGDNVVVEHRRGGWDLVKVVDFGIARLVGQERQEKEKTICGTPEYMAPEVIQGGDATFASDIYAVGIMLYELLCGITPFAGGPTIEVLRRHLTETAVPPSKRFPERTFNPLLEECAMRAIAKEADRRFASAADFRLALKPRSVRGPAFASRRTTSQDIQLCDSCQAPLSHQFKFCPECGNPRQTGEMGELGRAETIAPPTAQGGAGSTPDDWTGMAAEGIGARATRSVSTTERLALQIHFSRPPLVGRDSEVQLLDRFLGDFEGLHGGDNALMVAGPTGSGRARLVEEALSRLDPSVRRNMAGPDPTYLDRPFYPIRLIACDALDVRADESRPLTDLLASSRMSQRDLPAVAELLRLEGPLWQLEAPVRRREILASVGRLFQRQSERGPSVLVFESVDTYDEPSRQVLCHVLTVVRNRPQTRVLLTGQLSALSWLPEWLVHMELGPLAGADIEPLVDSVRRISPSESVLDADVIAEITEGNSARLEHLLRFVAEGGAIETAPTSAADLAAARLDHLPFDAMLVLQAVSILGRDARLGWIEYLTGLDAPGLRAASVVLAGRDLIREIEDGDGIRFSSSLMRNVVYEAMPARVRRELHQRAAILLAEAGAEAALLGHHYELGGELGDAARLLWEAGDEAGYELDASGARRLYQRALQCARQVMLDSDDPAARSQYVAIAVKLAESLRVDGQLGLARGLLDEVEGHCYESRALQAQHKRAYAHLYAAEGNSRRALDTLRQATGFAIMTGQRELLCNLYLDVAVTQLRAGEVASATAEVEEGVDLITTGEGPAALDGPPSMWRLLQRLAQLYRLQHQTEQALRTAIHALRHAERVGARVGMARIQTMLATMYEDMDEMEQALEMRRRAVEDMRILGDRRATAELLLDGARPTHSFAPITPDGLREARELAEEIGWSDGVMRAQNGGAG